MDHDTRYTVNVHSNESRVDFHIFVQVHRSIRGHRFKISTCCLRSGQLVYHEQKLIGHLKSQVEKVNVMNRIGSRDARCVSLATGQSAVPVGCVMLPSDVTVTFTVEPTADSASANLKVNSTLPALFSFQLHTSTLVHTLHTVFYCRTANQPRTCNAHPTTSRPRRRSSKRSRLQRRAGRGTTMRLDLFRSLHRVLASRRELTRHCCPLCIH